MLIEPSCSSVLTSASTNTFRRASIQSPTTRLVWSNCKTLHPGLQQRLIKEPCQRMSERVTIPKYYTRDKLHQGSLLTSQSRWLSKCVLNGSARSLKNCKRSFSSDSFKGRFGKLTEQDYHKSKQRFRPITSREITSLFGPDISQSQGNHLLDTLQKQRVTGTLDYDVEGPGYNAARIAKALQWLRMNYRLDEDAAIVARIEREEAIYTEWKPQQSANSSSNSVYGDSELERRIEEIKEEKKRLQKEAEMTKMTDLRTDQSHKPTVAVGHSSHRQLDISNGGKGRVSEWVRKYREQAKLSDLEKPPKVNPLQVIGSCTIFAMVLTGSCVWLASNYVPPPRNARLFPDVPPAAATICGIIAINVAVWMMWKLPPFWRFMNRNFLLIPATPNPISMIGSVFSHHGVSHLALNMVGLWFIGTSLCDEIGRGKFLALYLACGVAGSWLSLFRFVALKNYTFSTLGASGAVFGVVASYCSLFPSQRITLALLPEQWKRLFAMKAEYVLYTLLLLETVACLRGRIGSIDHAAHLGGLLAGVAGAEVLRRQARLGKQVLGQAKPTSFRK